MTDAQGAAQAIGALLARVPDVHAGAAAVHVYLVEPNSEHATQLERLGLSAEGLEEFRPVLPQDFGGIAEVCVRASVWAMARKQSETTSMWEPVVTGHAVDPTMFRRRTAETLIGLAIEAGRYVKLFAPFADIAGIRAIGTALAGATRRGAAVSFAHRSQSAEVAEELQTVVAQEGSPDYLRTIPIASGLPYPHLKIMVSDGRQAYLGSANLTYAALVSNLEVGALVSGSGVGALERMFDVLVTQSEEAVT